jgi:dolichyl-phosphate beta-glucosyltransferase
MSGMLEEAVEYLQSTFPQPLQSHSTPGDKPKGWEILVVNDGSSDKTIDTALSFARDHQLCTNPPTPAGPWSSNDGPKTRSKSAPKVETVSTSIPHGSIRVISLEQNRGKGGAVTHGMRHARGAYVVFADADGASRFSDLGKLMENCDRVADTKGRAVGVGSRAHMVGSEAVVKVTKSQFTVLSIIANPFTALFLAKRSHALFPSSASTSYTPSHIIDQGHAVRLQAVHTPCSSLHYPIHA